MKKCFPYRGTQWLAVALSVSALGMPNDALSQEVSRQSVSERYEANAVFRFMFGNGYRDLWISEDEYPVLDLSAEGGGLVPTGRFGGLQTAVLGFVGKDGRKYSFRGTDKDPSAVLGPLLKDTVVETIIQDQMAAQHPGGPPVAGVLTEAAGVLTIRERTVVMPDDARLGEYREEFAGRIGSFFEYPEAGSELEPGLSLATEIINHEEFYERLKAGDDDQVDVRAFLRARLLDILMGDFDRHRKQWRWARIPGQTGWQPIPEDRDQAFVRSDGLGPAVIRLYIPILQNYADTSPSIKGLTLHGWEQDRWLLPRLSWSEWTEVIDDIVGKLSDETLERALAQLPASFGVLDGERFRRDVRARRDRLPALARRFYEHLAREVDVQMSDQSERVRVVRAGDGSMRVEVFRADQSGGEGKAAPIFSRTFAAGETRDVRLYLRAGEDHVEVEGKPGSIDLRVMATEGQKVLNDTAGGGTRVYDENDLFAVSPGPGTKIDQRSYTPPPSDAGFVDVEDVPPRDWGSDTIPIPDFSIQPDAGVYLGLTGVHTRYGFRKHPWSSRHRVTAGWAFEANEPRVQYQGLFRPENSQLLAGIDLEYSGIEVLRFYGFGNETSDRGNDRFFRVRNQLYRIEPKISLPLGDERLRLSGGPIAKLSRTRSGARLIDELNPYGNHDFGLIGAKVSLTLDTRTSSVEEKYSAFQLPFHENPAGGYPVSGFLIDVSARVSPPVWDVDETYGSIEGSASGFLSFGKENWATLAARVGGKETFGQTPFFDLAYIGGGRFFSGAASNRGFRSRRFAGDSSVYGNLDARVVLGRAKIVVPSDFGIQAFFDTGRVFFNDESSDDWHFSGGGGVWISPLVRTNTISVSVAGGEEDLLAYLRFGFHY